MNSSSQTDSECQEDAWIVRFVVPILGFVALGVAALASYQKRILVDEKNARTALLQTANNDMRLLVKVIKMLEDESLPARPKDIAPPKHYEQQAKYTALMQEVNLRLSPSQPVLVSGEKSFLLNKIYERDDPQVKALLGWLVDTKESFQNQQFRNQVLGAFESIVESNEKDLADAKIDSTGSDALFWIGIFISSIALLVKSV